jgi:hypothetical protein
MRFYGITAAGNGRMTLSWRYDFWMIPGTSVGTSQLIAGQLTDLLEMWPTGSASRAKMRSGDCSTRGTPHQWFVSTTGLWGLSALIVTAPLISLDRPLTIALDRLMSATRRTCFVRDTPAPSGY